MDEQIQKVLGSDDAGEMRQVGAGADGESCDPGQARPLPSDAQERVSHLRQSATGAGLSARGGQRRGKISEEEWKLIDADYARMTGEAVAAKYGVSVHTIYARHSGCGKLARAREQKKKSFWESARDWGVEIALGVGGCVAAPFLWIAALVWSGVRLGRAGAQRSLHMLRSPRIAVRRHHSPEVWAAARRDYERGATAPAVAAHYGMSEAAVKKRACLEGWCKTVMQAPPPLVPDVDPAQVDGEGKSIWADIAHEAQIPPQSTANGGAWLTWLFQGGRGAGKTRAGAEWLAARAAATPHGRFALVGPTQRDVREVMIEGPSGLMNLPGRERPQWESSRRRLKWRNGAVAFAFSAEEPERLRGPQFEAAWADEFCCWPKPAEALSNLRLALRRGKSPQLVVTTTPKPIATLRKLRDEASCAITQAPSAVNAANLAPTFLSGLEAIYGGTTLAKQELEGVLLDGDGALWTRARLSEARGGRPEKFDRVVVGVDPPAGVDGAACGIVVVGKLAGRGYVLADRSAAGLTPNGWALRVAEAAREFGAAKIIAEGNQGGEMVRTTLLAAQVPCNVEIVHASVAKRARAEPASALYEQKRVTHCGEFALLEQEMLELGIGEVQTGLDRADALVWALTHLLVVKPPPAPKIIDLWANE